MFTQLLEKLKTSCYLFLVIVSLFTLTGCITSSLIKTETEAVHAGFHRQKIKTEDFSFFAYVKINDVTDSTLVIYIEGDGYAWKRKNKLSNDPTPKNPVSLKLAISDVSQNVAYLARPCQYLDETELKDCSSKYWSSHRYAEEVISAMSEAITKIKMQSNASNIEIIAYSGGGAVAMLIAAQRNDVTNIITIAANIDHESWSEWHGISKLKGSLSPLNYLAKLKGIKQMHFWGDKDDVVPYKTQLLLIENSKINSLFKYKIIPDFTHNCCWVKNWPDILQK